MASTSNRKTSEGPYSLAQKLKVLSCGQPSSYTRKDGEEKQSMTVGVSDGSSVHKLIVYDPAKFKYMKVGHTIVTRETIRREEDGIRTIIITKNSKVFMGAPMEVPSAHDTQADRIVNPPPAEEKSVKDALGSPAKKKITVKGKVVQEDEIKTVSVRGEEVKIKTIMLKDSTETAKITLWRDLATADTRPGDYIQVTDVVVNIYNNQASLQTTSRSNVKKSEVPEVKKVVTVEGICIDDTEAELFLDDESTLQIELCILLSALSLESDEDIMANGSFKLDVVCSGDRILSAIAAT